MFTSFSFMEVRIKKDSGSKLGCIKPLFRVIKPNFSL
uniref:Uncharacterized protein n=1 Tax=viral metagenome TaxID=1070528 RepID=A0A6C0JVW2_9ZZZZ